MIIWAFDINPKAAAVGISCCNSEDYEGTVTEVKWTFSIGFTAYLLGHLWKEDPRELLIPYLREKGMYKNDSVYFYTLCCN